MEKKRGFNVQINFSNKWLYTFIILGIFIIIGVGVHAYGTSDPLVFGHSAGEIMVDIDGSDYTLQEAIEGGLLGGGAGSIVDAYGNIHILNGGHANLASSIYEISGTNIAGQTVYAYDKMCVGNSAGDCSGAGGTIISSGGIIAGAVTAREIIIYGNTVRSATSCPESSWGKINRCVFGHMSRGKGLCVCEYSEYSDEGYDKSGFTNDRHSKSGFEWNWALI